MKERRSNLYAFIYTQIITTFIGIYFEPLDIHQCTSVKKVEELAIKNETQMCNDKPFKVCYINMHHGKNMIVQRITRMRKTITLIQNKEGLNMTELERLISAKDCMDKLANGMDPTSDEVLPKDTILNNVSISRGFFLISDVLRQVIENGGTVTKRTGKSHLPPFTLPDELRNQIEITEQPTMIKHFTDRINSLADESAMRKLKVTALTSWLVSNGYLCEEVVNDKKRKKPTKAGEKLGIYSEEREGQYGGYLAILYKESAQRHIVSNLNQIIAISNGE